LLPPGWFVAEDERGRWRWVHERYAHVRLICGEESRLNGGGLLGRFSIEGSTVLAHSLLTAIEASESMSTRLVIAEPLRLAIIAEDSAAAQTEPAPLNASGRAPAEPNIERSAAE
jgi:hypothetical protein